MDRKRAILLLASEDMQNLSHDQRADILQSDWWRLDETDAAFRSLPEDICQLIANSDAPATPDDPRFDSLLIQSLTDRYVGVRNDYIRLKVNDLVDQETQVTGNVEPLFACPCCGYRTMRSVGEYEICSACFWEDCGVKDMEQFASPNHQTLAEAKQNFAEIGACRQSDLEYVDKESAIKYLRVGAL